MQHLNKDFFDAFLSIYPNSTVNTDDFPEALKAGEEDEDGWIEWKLLPGNFSADLYHDLEKKYNVIFPESFINWHRSHFFMDAQTEILNLPYSNPDRPLQELEAELNNFISAELIPQKLYPFGSEGNDMGPLVFDGREPKPNNEFPVRVYDHEAGGDLKGLSPVIFSSFTKLLECQIHFLTGLKSHRKNYEIIPEFFTLDPDGAGAAGKDYWNGWIAGMKATEQ